MSADPTLPSSDGTADESAEGTVAIGRVLAKKYRVTKLLGTGGMGSVFQAQHLTLGVDVALKVMHAHVAADPDVARRFGREARAISIIDHPNVVRIMDFGVDDAVPYIVMELLRGISCGAWLEALTAPPPLAEVLAVCEPVLGALDVAHRAGVVHRDLKPDNVFLARDGAGNLSVKVVDFGLAHVSDPVDRGPTLTRNDMVAGTPSYMSPEQCRSLVVGPETDLYAFGCLLTELLQLAPPFEAPTTADLMSQHLFVRPKPLARPSGAEPIPPELERLRLDLLGKDAELRPHPASLVLERLRDALDPSSQVSRLASRKGHEASGDRDSRAGGWEPGAKASTPATASTRAARIVRLPGSTGVDGRCETGLAMQQIAIATQKSSALPSPLVEPLVVLDAGADRDGALRFLGELRAREPRAHVIVCLAELTTDRLNELVAAGASDAIGYPVSPDALARKVDRVLRRNRLGVPVALVAARALDSVALEETMHVHAVDPRLARGLRHVAVRPVEQRGDVAALEVGDEDVLRDLVGLLDVDRGLASRARGRARGGRVGRDPDRVRDHVPLDEVAELADVPRPAVGLHLGEDLRREEPARALRFHFHQKVIDEERNVLDPIAERRHAERHYREPIKQIFSKTAGVHLSFELPIRRRDHADVDAPGVVFAHPPDLALRERAEELRLHLERQLADLVEEHRPPVRRLEGADARLMRAGEGALRVTEELALHQVRGNRAAVDDHERLVAAAAVLDDLGGDELFSGPRLAVDVDGGVGLADARDDLEEPPHRRALPVERPAAQALADALRGDVGDLPRADDGGPELDPALGRDEIGVADQDAGHPRSVEGPAVFDSPAALAPRQPKVETRNERILDHDVVARVGADADHLAVDDRFPLRRFARLALDEELEPGDRHRRRDRRRRGAAGRVRVTEGRGAGHRARRLRPLPRSLDRFGALLGGEGTGRANVE